MSPRLLAALAALLLGGGTALADKKDTLDSIRAKKPAKPAPRKPAPRKPAPRAATTTKPPARPEPKPGEPKSQWVVSRLGGGDYTSIGEAVRKVPVGGRILVRGGVYPESVVLNRPVEIAPEGFDQAVIVESSAGPALLMLAEEAVVRNLTFRAAPAAGEKVAYTVDVPGGKLVLEGCEIGGGSKGGLWAHGEKAAPYLRKTNVRAPAGDGLFFSERAGGTVEDCELAQCLGAGARIAGGAKPVLQNCTARKNGEGVAVDEAAGALERCQLLENRGAGIRVGQAGSPTLRGCTLSANTGTGITVAGRARASLEACKLVGNGPNALLVTGRGSILNLRGCDVRETPRDGLIFEEGAGGLVEDCDFNRCHWSAVRMQTGANATLRKCRIANNDSFAVMANKDAKALVEDSDLSGSVHWPVAGAQAGGELTLRRCRISNGRHEGVMFWEKGTGTVEQCEIFQNQFAGVVVRGGSTPILRHCRIYGNRLEGIVFSEKGLGLIEECDLYDNGKKGLDIQTGAQPVVRSCRVR